VERLGKGGYGVCVSGGAGGTRAAEVALKVIKLGMDTSAVVARFELERQALALMDHPSIARVFDAGTTDSGRPFFAMELVRGSAHHGLLSAASTAHANPDWSCSSSLPGRAARAPEGHHSSRPETFEHSVTKLDGVPVPKIIDFGIAKATEAAAGPDMTAAKNSWARRPT
jgi:hypothetical protein